MNKDLEEKYYSLIDDNVNVGKRSDGKEFLILLFGLAVICFFVYFTADIFARIIIDNMSDKAQVKLENILSFGIESSKVNKHSQKIKYLNSIKPKIISLDKRLQGKSKFDIYEISNEDVNAFVEANGTIYFTSGLLEKVDNNEILTFILAHELGHYAHRDHLKSIGRELTLSMVLSLVTFGHKDVSSTIRGMTGINRIKHSQKQEENADIYANRVLYRLYGNNSAAVEFFEFLKKEENLPEFIYYFSTHPSNERRLLLIRHNR